ncbi:MAG: hypothetical protein PWQ57_3290 [Desulfovibrionales bacterium]|nr:hypothetical protein [Desulfovibrionales bacterium]
MASKNSGSTNIPAVPTSVDAATRTFLSAVKEILETMQGKRRGSGLEEVVTFGDLNNLGIQGRPDNIGDDALYDFSNFLRNSNPPNPPRDLAVVNSVVSNKLSWTNPANNAGDISHVEIWCAFGSESLSDALRVGVATAPTATFTHTGLNTRIAHAYWIRTVNWSGMYSSWEPATGGHVVPADSSATINDLLATLTDDAQYETLHKIVADSFMVLQPSAGLTEPRPVFTVGTIDGEAAVGVNGDAIVDGAILARMLDADIVTGAFLSASAQISLGLNGLMRLAEGARLLAGDGNFLLDTSGGTTKIIMGPDATIGEDYGVSVTSDYVMLSGSDIEFWRYMDGAQRLFKSIKRFETGWCANGATVLLPGYWESEPQIHLSPRNLTCFESGSPSVNQALNMQVTDISLADGSSYRYQFTANARLIISGGTADEEAGLSGSVSIEGGTAATADFTTDNYCTGATIRYQVKAVKPTALAREYYYRTATLKVYVDGSEAGSKTIPIGNTVDFVSGTITVSGLPSGVHNIHLTASAVDAVGTFATGATGYEYREASAEQSYGITATANVYIPEYNTGARTDSDSVSFTPPTAPPPSGDDWELYEAVYTPIASSSCSLDSGDLAGWMFSCSHDCTPDGTYASARGAGAITASVSADGHSTHHGSVTSSITLHSMSATLKYRRLMLATDSLLTAVEFSTISQELESVDVLATGTVNYLAAAT